MRILVTNDDGIRAPGLWPLVESLKRVGEVVVVAPDREQSGVGTSVTFHQPVRARKARSLVPGVVTYAVEGTPADSVILALGHLFRDGVDVVVAGINEGPNLGNDVFISGTVGAALQGYFYRLPALALSVDAWETSHFEAAAELARLLVEKIASQALPREMLLNINLPDRPLSQIEGIEITRLGARSYADVIQEGHDGRRKYYWIVRGDPQWDQETGTDIWALSQNRASITPIQINMANHTLVSLLRELAPFLFQALRQKDEVDVSH